MRRVLLTAVLAILPGVAGWSQSTQGLITGRVFSAAKSSEGIAGASISCTQEETGETRTAHAGVMGTYTLPALSPGEYSCRAGLFGSDGNPLTYQPRDTSELHLPVAGRADLDFPLRDLTDVYDQGIYAGAFAPATDAIVRMFAADVRTMHSAPLKVLQGAIGALEATVSQTIDRRELDDLPLAGRDAYTLIITQPGVADDTATARSLGLTANGQRPSASNFLLDGLENNNYLISGPLTTIAPEALQEYRISTTIYSAEFGRTSGYVANAITRSGTNQWHVLAYFDLENNVLNANDFQSNRRAYPRAPLKQAEPGFVVGGPLLKNRLFGSVSFDYFRFRSAEDPVYLLIPTQPVLPEYGVPKVYSIYSADYLRYQPPMSVNRYLATPRLDYVSPDKRHRLLARLALAKEQRPDFVWTPYPDFVMPLISGATSLATGWTWSLSSALTEELRAGWSGDDLRFDRPHSEVPTLVSVDDHAVLPGSSALYSFRNRDRSVEVVENLTWVKGRNIWKIGAGGLFRSIDGYLTFLRDREVYFHNVSDFVNSRVYEIDLASPRNACSPVCSSAPALPDYQREYAQNQYYFFAQNSLRLSARMVLNFGVRYENFGTPRNTGRDQDARLVPGGGATFAQRLQAASIDYSQAGDQALYAADNKDWAARVGFSRSLRRDARTVLRGGFGIFYDRPFDNEWENLRNNGVVHAAALVQTAIAPVTNYLTPPSASNPFGAAFSTITNSSRLTLYQPGIRSAYAENFLLGLQHQVTDSFWLEVNGLGSLGRRLITTDILNRANSTGLSAFSRPGFAPIYYRANQGASSYYALTMTARWRAPHSQFHIAWTWSHAIDNQSEPLNGDYFNLLAVSIVPQAVPVPTSFSRQFDSGADRGNSDFDQRHTVVFYSIWELPGFLRNWRFAQLAAYRSGLPFSVIGGTPGLISPVFNPRANLVNAAAVYSEVDAGDKGGTFLLDKTAFARSAFNVLGNTGRNEFRAPGFYNIDISLSRSFALRSVSEKARVTVRADGFNFLNHANLGAPNNLLNTSDFGLATRGRQGVASGFPAAIPFQETARQVQMLLRLEW